MEDSTKLKLVSSNKSFDGYQNVYEHYSNELKCSMKFSLYEPTGADKMKPLAVIIYLSGLTCTDQNFTTKAGFQKYASQHKIVVLAPDTSPRGCNIEGEAERWDFGVGASFYIDATEPKWKTNWRMFSYVNEEVI
jgi:S-formylglutathione hydrolase